MCEIKAIPVEGANTTTYVILPLEPRPEDYLQVAKDYSTNLVLVYGLDWDNDLTPWPAPGVPRGCAPFKGLADLFYMQLVEEIVPRAESTPGIVCDAGRRLVGVSLSGLFTLWQWLDHDLFDSIASISGSFWYEGFVEWMTAHHIEPHAGKAYFSLGDLEPHSKVQTFRKVGDCTHAVVDALSKAGIDTTFEWVPGNHYAPFIPRLQRALKALM